MEKVGLDIVIRLDQISLMFPRTHHRKIIMTIDSDRYDNCHQYRLHRNRSFHCFQCLF